jgi:hypothetical protein
MRYQKTIAEELAIKVRNNEPCPCGATRTREVFINGEKEPKLIGIPVKYKHCCKGKQLFFRTEADRKEAEADMNIRNPKRAKDIIADEATRKLKKKINASE